ncbi:helix-turn-helix domain-containing protein [Sphaerotilus natans]|uniref:helix-turn-helix domain-containing protein n=1 Tax=Sphaerotilus natans TaxID=34103 RepID=UPI00406C14E8
MSKILRSQPEATGGDPPVLAHVGANLRRLRTAAGLSQAALAAAADLSRRTLVGLEAGEANLSLAGLDRLARALGTDFVTLVAAPDATRQQVDALAWRGTHPDSRAVLLGSAPARQAVELWSWTLGPGEVYQAEPDPAGWHEMIVVTAGRLRLRLADETRLLEAGDHAIYGSARAYAYENAGEGPARFMRSVVG